MRKTFIIFILSISFFSLTTFAEAKQNYQNFDFTTIGFHGFYDLDLSEENGNIVARSIYDPKDSPHYIYNKEKNAWEDNHPGRNDIELLFPAVRDSGRTIWKELAGYEWLEQSKSYTENNLNRAVWNQDMLAYEYINLNHDQGHPVLWMPLMGMLEVSDENKGFVNYCETILSPDFENGKNGIKIIIVISHYHPEIEYFRSLPIELASKYYSQVFLDNFNDINGKQLIVRIIDEDITSISKTQLTLNRSSWLQGNGSKILDQYVAGYNENVSENIDLITLSLRNPSHPLSVYWGISCAINVKNNGSENAINNMKALDISNDMADVFLKLKEDSEIDNIVEIKKK